MNYNEQEETILRRVGSRNIDKEAEEMREQVFRRALSKIGAHEELRQNKHHSTVLTLNRRKLFYWGIAASVALFILLPLTFWLGEWNNNRLMADTWVEVSTPGATISRIELPDGSKVVINGRSSIRYPRLFSNKEREVKLNGEAYFEVEHDARRPFIVRSEELNVQVLGTRFNMKCYHEDPIYKVALNEGSVKVFTYSDQDAIIMKPNQEVVLSRRNRSFIQRSINASEDIAWINGQLNFRSDHLSDIIKTIERMFDIKVDILNPDIASIEYYCQISTNETPEKILTLLSSTGKFKFHKITASHYVIE